MLVQARNVGMTDDEIRNQYEQPLSEAELAAAWDYYAGQREEIDQQAVPVPLPKLRPRRLGLRSTPMKKPLTVNRFRVPRRRS